MAFNNPSGNPTSGGGVIGVGSGAPASSLYINSTGNVGIGTTSLSYPFEVAKDGPVASGNWVNVASIRDSARNKGLGFGYDSSSQTGIITAFTSSAASNLAFWTYDSSSWGERVRITGAGNVGIGTAAPGAKLEVTGQIKITGGVPGANKVLTSDAAGLASWQAPSSPGVTLPSGAVFMMITGSCPAGTTDASVAYANKFLRINATQGSTGGSDTLSIAEANLPSHTHGVGTLTAANESAHTHTENYPNNGGGGSYDGAWINGALSGRPLLLSKTTTAGTPHTHTLSGSTGATGSGVAATITNPYVTAKMCQVN